MINSKINNLKERCNGRLRSMCGAMNPDTRIYLVITLFLLFAALSAYYTTAALCALGSGSGGQLRIEHIEPLELKDKSGDACPETVNSNGYERTRETAE